MKERIGDWMCTYSDGRYWPADPSSDDVRILDIAHALSMLCRYTGHCREFYSVAEHSVLVSQVVPPEYAMIGLLHDAPEAYLNDVNKPLKHSLPDYRKIEDLNWDAIAARFNLPSTVPAAVHAADMAVLKAESLVLMPDSAREWSIPGPVADVRILALEPKYARAIFLDRFLELTAAP